MRLVPFVGFAVVVALGGAWVVAGVSKIAAEALEHDAALTELIRVALEHLELAESQAPGERTIAVDIRGATGMWCGKIFVGTNVIVGMALDAPSDSNRCPSH